MANTLKKAISNESSWKKFCILIKTLMRFVLKGQIHNKPTLFQVMSQLQANDKPLPEPVWTMFYDGKRYLQATMS